jgi:Phage tail lysozyme
VPLILGFAVLVGGVLLLTSGITSASFADVLKGNARTTYDANRGIGLAAPAAAAAGAGAAAAPATGKLPNPSAATGSVVKQAGAVLIAAGLTPTAAAGVIGNAYQESSWDTASVGDGGGGLWGFSSGAISLASLQAYAASKGVAWTNPTLQAEFLVKNLSASDISALNAQGSPAAAASWFMDNWEHPAVATENEARRIQGAEIAFKELS